jgi:hypothetical protein
MKRALKFIYRAPYGDVEDFVLQNLEMAWNHVPLLDLIDADVRVDVFHASLKSCSLLHARTSKRFFEMGSVVE